MTKTIPFISLTTGKIYYFDPITGGSKWDNYSIEPISGTLQLPWKIIYSKSGKPYYYNTQTGVSQWRLPKDNILSIPTSDPKSSITTDPLSSVLSDPLSSVSSDPLSSVSSDPISSISSVPISSVSTSVSSSVSIDERCKKISGLHNIHNSCFIDSVLQALFVSPNMFSETILNCDLSADTRSNICQKDVSKSIKVRRAIQQELQNISQTILGTAEHKVRDVSKLRSLIKHCPVGQSFHGHGQHDSGEFLTYLLEFFPISSTATTKVATWGTNSTDVIVPKSDLSNPSIVIDDKASVVIAVDPFTLMNQDSKVNISHYLTEYNDDFLDEPYIFEGAGYKRRISEKIMISSPIVIINLNRRDPLNRNSVIESSIIPDERIRLSGGQEFYFSAVVLFQNRHYVCYYNCGGMWYLYNDLSHNKRKYIGTYDTLLRSTDIITSGVTFYYNIL